MADYLTRFDRTGRALGLGPATVTEVDDRKGGGAAAEGVLLMKASAGAGARLALDERGKLQTSPDFAQLLAGWRDAGRGELAFLIGGADGLSQAVRSEVDASVSFGPLVWPHMLARVMLCEQLYRAASILSGAPYHRA